MIPLDEVIFGSENRISVTKKVHLNHFLNDRIMLIEFSLSIYIYIYVYMYVYICNGGSTRFMSRYNSCYRFMFGSWYAMHMYV